MSKKVVFVIICLMPLFCGAQKLLPTVLSSGGKEYTANGIQMSYTIGELAVSTLNASNMKLTQGYQQPLIVYMNTTELPSEYQIRVFPNPTSDIVHVELTLSKVESKNNFVVDVRNMLGEKVLVPISCNLFGGSITFIIDFSQVKQGQYYTRIITKDALNKDIEFKVLKVY